MSPSEELNKRLQGTHSGAARCLSDLGRRLFFPQGIPAQTAEAAGCRLNATIGQVTDGKGRPLPLPSMSRHLVDLDSAQVFLYARQGGLPALRRAWSQRIRNRHPSVPAMGLPLVTHGLTHGLSLVSDLFVDETADVLLPSPGWGNYHHIFGTRRGGRLVPYALFEGRGPERFFSVSGLERALGEVRDHSVLVLNFPGNPTGFTPDVEQARQVLQVILSHDKPLVVVCDDAYQGMLWEPGLQPKSLFYGLLEGASENLLPIKIDGATKELLFFGGRVGFLTFGVPEAACSILDEKARACARATVSSAPTPSQALVLSALNSDDTGAQIERAFGVLQSRYQSLRRALDDAGIAAWPFNSGCFALVGTQRDPQQLRRELIENHSVGLVAIPAAGALRIAYCSLGEAEIPALVERLAASLV